MSMTEGYKKMLIHVDFAKLIALLCHSFITVVIETIGSFNINGIKCPVQVSIIARLPAKCSSKYQKITNECEAVFHKYATQFKGP